MLHLLTAPPALLVALLLSAGQVGVAAEPRLGVVFGDSITQGGALPAAERPRVWVNLMEKDSAGRLTLVNEGKTDAGAAADARVLAEASLLVGQDAFRPACVIRYDRHAYRFVDAAGHEQLRITFDHGIRVRFNNLTPCAEDASCALPVLEDGLCLMEVKGATAVPYDFAAHLSAREIFPRSFSKYSESVRLHGATPTFSA